MQNLWRSSFKFHPSKARARVEIHKLTINMHKVKMYTGLEWSQNEFYFHLFF